MTPEELRKRMRRAMCTVCGGSGETIGVRYKLDKAGGVARVTSHPEPCSFELEEVMAPCECTKDDNATK